MARFLVIGLLLALAACASGPPKATGPWQQLNVGSWDYRANMLTTPPAGF